MPHDYLHGSPAADAALAPAAPHRRQLLAGIFASLVILGALAMLELGVSLALVSVAFVGVAFTVALLCWVLGIRSERDAVSAWDLAGASALLGFAAAAIAD